MTIRALSLAVAALLLLPAQTPARATGLLDEDFGALASFPTLDLTGTAFHGLDGSFQGRDDDLMPLDIGRYLRLGVGWYAEAYDPVTAVGDSKIESVAGFDLLAGVAYTLDFDWSRGVGSAGNGPFPLSLTAEIAGQSVRVDDVTGFYYGLSWQRAELSWVQPATVEGAHLRFTADGAYYASVSLDNVRLSVSAVPEPAALALMLAGLPALAWARRAGLTRRP